jgi:hypothetical protein
MVAIVEVALVQMHMAAAAVAEAAVQLLQTAQAEAVLAVVEKLEGS